MGHTRGRIAKKPDKTPAPTARTSAARRRSEDDRLLLPRPGRGPALQTLTPPASRSDGLWPGCGELHLTLNAAN